ncbi:MAG: PCRF domain-containing protein, partial [Acidimicrobiia bacterium]|nr:PCRF domain-containing protein [Acidimicrobiia bacterium]
MADLTDDLRKLRVELGEAEQYLRIDVLRDRLPQLETEMARPDLWDDAERARAVQTEFTAVRDDLDLYERLLRKVEDAETLWELSREEGDESSENEARELIDDLEHQFTELELRALFTGQYDEGDAVCEVHSGAGGTDSQDWAEMLLRMYLRWAESRGFEIEMKEASEGEEAGLKSATFIVRGENAYGLF